MYTLVRHCGVDYDSAWNMPIEMRKWWIGNVHKENEKLEEMKPKPLKK